MEYQCGVCKQKVAGGLVPLTEHTERHIVDLIKIKHPEWIEDNGVCKKCLDYYKQQLKGSQ